MITDFPNNLRQFVYLSRYAPPTPPDRDLRGLTPSRPRGGGRKMLCFVQTESCNFVL